jgi:hypothetical protein
VLVQSGQETTLSSLTLTFLGPSYLLS